MKAGLENFVKKVLAIIMLLDKVCVCVKYINACDTCS